MILPKISIVTVVFNGVSTIRESIESVLSQSYPNIEYIVVDGGSIDGTIAVINEYASRIDVIISEPDKGIYDAMNKGVRIATGDWIGMLNSDDIYADASAIEKIISNSLCSNAEIVFGNLTFFSGNDYKLSGKVVPKLFKPWMLCFGVMPPHPSVFIKKLTYEKNGLYALKYKTGADFELFVRYFCVNNLKYQYIDVDVVMMRIGGVTTSGFRSSMNTTLDMFDALHSNNMLASKLLLYFRLPVKWVIRKISVVL
jgi:glycosyltransferase involved in cell wall biosynthesis